MKQHDRLEHGCQERPFLWLSLHVKRFCDQTYSDTLSRATTGKEDVLLNESSAPRWAPSLREEPIRAPGIGRARRRARLRWFLERHQSPSQLKPGGALVGLRWGFGAGAPEPVRALMVALGARSATEPHHNRLWLSERIYERPCVFTFTFKSNSAPERPVIPLRLVGKDPTTDCSRVGPLRSFRHPSPSFLVFESARNRLRVGSGAPGADHSARAESHRFSWHQSKRSDCATGPGPGFGIYLTGSPPCVILVVGGQQ